MKATRTDLELMSGEEVIDALLLALLVEESIAVLPRGFLNLALLCRLLPRLVEDLVVHACIEQMMQMMRKTVMKKTNIEDGGYRQP